MERCSLVAGRQIERKKRAARAWSRLANMIRTAARLGPPTWMLLVVATSTGCGDDSSGSDGSGAGSTGGQASGGSNTGGDAGGGGAGGAGGAGGSGMV